MQTLWPRVRRPLSTLTRDITLVPFAKIGLIVSLLVKTGERKNQRFERCLEETKFTLGREFFENFSTLGGKPNLSKF